jgi:hypothetical protein
MGAGDVDGTDFLCKADKRLGIRLGVLMDYAVSRKGLIEFVAFMLLCSKVRLRLKNV